MVPHSANNFDKNLNSHFSVGLGCRFKPIIIGALIKYLQDPNDQMIYPEEHIPIKTPINEINIGNILIPI